MNRGKFITSANYKSRSYPYPWGITDFNSHSIPFEPYEGTLILKREFSLDKAWKKVTVRATALGVFELYMNGSRVGTRTESGMVYDELKPGWTDYDIKVFSYEYDITELCWKDNLFAAEVSPGWWAGRVSFGRYGFKSCAFCAELEITYTDGSTQSIATDESWQSAVCGPLLRADLWDGEYYDATIPHAYEQPQAHSFQKAVLFEDFQGEILPVRGPSVRIKESLQRKPLTAEVVQGVVADGTDFGAVNVVDRRAGEHCEKGTLLVGQTLILDLGQVIVGRPKLVLKAARGTKIKVFFGEMLNDSGERVRGNLGAKGSVYTENYRSALARIVYIAAGTGVEEYVPLHAFYGFRYIEISADGDVELISVEGQVIGSELTETAEFSCDNPEVNQLYSNAVWGMRGNYLTVPTDCPQRDERLGWTGDTQLFCGAASYIADIDDFMGKWLADMRDSQKGYDGAYGDVAPRIVPEEGNAAWGDAGFIVPYRLWLMYGNREILEEHYASMEEYMAYLGRNGLEGGGTAYGDWLNYDITDKRYVAVCYYGYDALLMERISRILGKEDRARHYCQLKERIIAHWRERYMDEGELIYKTQTAYLLPLAFEFVAGQEKQKLSAQLRQAIERNDYTLSTGFVGTAILNQTLEKLGLYDLCYDLLLQTKDPSWPCSVRQGATTIWERWNSYTLQKGFGEVSMNSFNHYAYGAVAEWFFSGMCGILPDENFPGFERFILSPTPDMREYIPQDQQRICCARAAYRSRKGRIESSWERNEDGYTYHFVIPRKVQAQVRLLCDGAVSVNGQPVTEFVRENDRTCFVLEAGVYTVKAYTAS